MVNSISEDTSLYSIAHISLRLSGLIRMEGNETLSFLYMASIHLKLFTFGISLLLEICKGAKDFEILIEQWSVFATYLTILSRFIHFFSKQQQILHIFNTLEAIDEEMSKDEESRYFTKVAENFGRKIIKITTIFISSSPILWFILSTIYDIQTNFKNKRLIAQMWIPWSMEQTWAYMLTKIFSSFISLGVIVAYRAVFVFDFVFTFQMSAYLKILQNYLETKGVKDVKIFQQHKLLIELINDYNKFISGFKFFDVALVPLMPCGFGLTILKTLKRSGTISFDSFQRIIIVIIPTVITCLCGQELIIQVERLHEASYMSNWYGHDQSYRRNLLTLMIRTTKVTTVNYRLFVTFDRDLLSQVLQRMYSYFMVIYGFVDTTDD
ncbi:hypothetical protein O3M35_008842 [Rhynocoris fuscipes]|uniref:Odorant receptor n=2 Tax=Rhynocoris fuscipes TaxID=488301 RepID=A0AAW1D7M7_9HEMI